MLLPPRTSSHRPRLLIVLFAAVIAAGLLATSASSAWVLNQVKLDTGICGQNLGIGSDPTASTTATPSFVITGDGGMASYNIFMDGGLIGLFRSDGSGNVCVYTSIPLSDGPHILTGNELAPNASLLVGPYNFRVDTVPPAAPSTPVLNPSADSGVQGDGVTSIRNLSLSGTSDPGVSIKVYKGPSSIGGAVSDGTGHWTAATSPLADGSYSIGAAAFDSAGNKSALPPPMPVIVDGTAPSVSISGPAADATVSGLVDVTTTVSDTGGMWKVEFQVDGVTKTTDTTSPFSYSWSSTTAANGPHTLTAVATDAAGNTTTSAAVPVTVANGSVVAPGAPILNAPTVGNASVALAWNAPASNGGSPITGYKIYRGTTSGSETLFASVGAVTGWTDTGLTNGTTYWYQVTATNAAGESVRSNERFATPIAPAGVPGAPNLTTATPGNASVGLAWAPTSDGGSPITGYKIYRGTTSGGETLLATVPVGTTYTDASALNGVTYYYQVSATNFIGESVRSTERFATPTAPATAPGAPSLTGISAGNAAVTINWSAPASNGGSAIVEYRVYRHTSGGAATFLASAGLATSYTDATAANGTTYWYSISARNAIGEGSRSNELSSTPAAPATVPGMPGLSSAMAGNASVTLNWTTPANGGSPITGYRVYRGTTSGGEALIATVGVTTSWTDGNAANGTTYYYQVSAVNGVGEGSRSLERSAMPSTTPDAPSLNSATAGNATVALTWTTPSSGGSAITEYRVYRHTSGGTATFLASAGLATSFTDATAANGTTYWYSVSARNASGEGSRSNELSATPVAPATAPAAPMLTAASAANGTVTLTWTTPADGGSAITGYKVYRGNSSGTETLLGLVGTATTWVDASVVNGTTYWYQVSAVNNVGDSIRSNELSTMPTTVPAAPSLVSAVPGNSVTLTWMAPSATGGLPVTGYRIYRGTSSGNTTFLTSVGAVTTYTDETTSDGLTYYFQVSAVTAAGEGAKSNELSVWLPTIVPTDTTPPSKPASMKALIAGTTQIIVDWPASTDNVAVTGYKVYRNSVFVALVQTSWFVDSGLTPGATYSYFVNAVDAAGNESLQSSAASARAVSLSTSSTGAMSGVAFNGAGTPITNVVASLRLPNGSLKTAKTTNTGVWKFSNLPPGDYTVSLARTGSPTTSLILTAQAGRTILTAVTTP